MMSVLVWLADVLAGLEVEILVFAIAFSVHRLVFGRRGPSAGPKKFPEASLKPKLAPPIGGPLRAPSEGGATTGRRAAAAHSAQQDLRAALAASDFPASLRHLRAAAPLWRSVTDTTPSAAPDALLLRLVRLAVEQSMVPMLLGELGVCGLLTERAMEVVLAESTKSTCPITVCQIMQLARAHGLQPTCTMQCSLLKSLGAEGRLEEALEVFGSCDEKPACLRNAILDACVNCGDMRAATDIMAAAQADGVADVTSYNTVIKAHLKSGEMRRAWSVMEAMRAAGIPPNVVTFNEFISTIVRSNPDGVWKVIDEMDACGVQPNQSTCSILLKGIHGSSRGADVQRALAMLDTVNPDCTNELLLCSACEACIRAGRGDLLRQLLERLDSGEGRQLQGAHAFGSIIRARGYLGDLAAVWDGWGEMRRRNIRPTSVTTGCMVEALVTNDGPEAGHRLIREVMSEEGLRPLVNSVIYNSVLKGLVQRERFDRVWEIYEEMLREQVQLSLVTYNTLIDVCSKRREMARIPALLEEMARAGIQATVVTYSTILKGYVQENHLESAFQLLDEMKNTRGFMPDEITYNTLLDGCARNRLFESGMQVLADMQENGVRPSNYTLSLLVKLANRTSRLEKAFELCDDISRQYGLSLNIYVYNNLMQACAQHRDVGRALKVLEKAVREGVRPDARTYGILLRGCVGAGDGPCAAGLVAAASGLRSPPPPVADAAGLQVSGGLPADLLSETLGAIASQRGGEDLAMQLLKDLRGAPGATLDPKVVLRLTSRLSR